MTDPVEIVARALCWHSEIGAWSPPEVNDRDRRWVEDHWIDWENEARAALAAYEEGRK